MRFKHVSSPTFDNVLQPRSDWALHGVMQVSTGVSRHPPFLELNWDILLTIMAWVEHLYLSPQGLSFLVYI